MHIICSCKMLRYYEFIISINHERFGLNLQLEVTKIIGRKKKILFHYCKTSTMLLWFNLCLLYFSADAHKGLSVFDRTEYFDKINVNISWSVVKEAQKIYFQLVAPIISSNSWVALGFSDHGGMKGGDIALISLHHQHLFDLHANANALPIMDKMQNWKLNNLERFASHSVIEMERPLITCDREDFKIDGNRLKHNILIAYNQNDLLLHKTTEYKLLVTQHSH
eukprot:409149_1